MGILALLDLPKGKHVVLGKQFRAPTGKHIMIAMQKLTMLGGICIEMPAGILLL